MTKRLINPLGIIAGKQKVGQEDAAEIELRVLLHFDAAKRGQCTHAGHNFIARHIIAAGLIGNKLKANMLVTQAMTAGRALAKAGERPTPKLDLTTNEYTSIRDFLKTYFRVLPGLEVAVLHNAQRQGEQILAAA